MRIDILGSGTGVPSADRGPAGCVVAMDDNLLLIDSGSGSLSRLARQGLDYRRISGGLFTHCHVDHTLDLVSLLHALNFTPGYVHKDSLRLVGPAGFVTFVGRLLAAYPSLLERSYELELLEVGDGTVVDLDWVGVAAAEVPHGNASANGYLVTTVDGVVVFSGDCSPSLGLADLARGADLLVSEASFTRATAESWPHMTAGEAGHLAQTSGVGTLILTHFYPGASESEIRAACSREYVGELILAHDGMCVEVAGGRVTVADAAASMSSGVSVDRAVVL